MLRKITALCNLNAFRRTLFTFPNIPSLGPSSQTFKEEKPFPYTEKELYSIVADVASYPQFIPYCLNSRVDDNALRRAMFEETVMNAELTVGFLNFKETYDSQVTCIPFKSVQALASSSTPLFKALTTNWNFQNATSSAFPDTTSKVATLVSLDLTYEFSNPIHASASRTFFGQVSTMMIKAFENRCLKIYGPRS